MAEFSKLIITDKGKELLAGVTTSANKIEFTRVSTSDRAYTENEIAGLTDLAGIKQTNHISSVAVQQGGKIQIEAAFENRELLEGYFIRSIGVYVKAEGNSEVLYAVAIEKTGRYSIPAYNKLTVSAVYLKLFLAVENFENVKLEVSPGAFITSSEVVRIRNELIAEQEKLKKTLAETIGESINGIDGKVTEILNKLIALENAIYYDITGNSWRLSFTNLEGAKVTKGNYNSAKKRIEC